MALIIDADVIIRGERGLFDLPAWLEMQADKGPRIAAITVAELWHGVERATANYKPRRKDYLSPDDFPSIAHCFLYRDDCA